MSLPDVTEQRLEIYFVFTFLMQISNIAEDAENMFKSIVHFRYMI
jgi:hypothetical protein